MALCNVGRDAALYATDRHVAALPSTAGDVKARGTLFTAEDSVLARLQELYDVLSETRRTNSFCYVGHSDIIICLVRHSTSDIF